jgi:hypothetical protein
VKALFNHPWIALASLLALAGCASAQPQRTSAMLSPDLVYRPPLPRELGRTVQAAQLITARYRDETYAFEAYLGVTPDTLTMIATDPFGRRALTLTWGETGLTVERATFVPEFIRSENILADITIAYWPEDAVRAGLAGTGATLQADPRRRVIAFGGQDIIEVSYESAPGPGLPALARFRNLAFGYALDLRSAASE